MSRRPQLPDWLQGVPAPVLAELLAAVTLAVASIVFMLVAPVVIFSQDHTFDTLWSFASTIAGLLSFRAAMKWMDRAENRIVASHAEPEGDSA